MLELLLCSHPRCEYDDEYVSSEGLYNTNLVAYKAFCTYLLILYLALSSSVSKNIKYLMIMIMIMIGGAGAGATWAVLVLSAIPLFIWEPLSTVGDPVHMDPPGLVH